MIRSFIFTVTILSVSSGCVGAEGLNRTTVDPFIDELVGRHGFDQGALRSLFDKVERLPSVLAAISRPAESKPWYQYRPIFVTPSRAQAGAALWRKHSQLLAQVEKRYEVPAEVILAIIGVETFYGRQSGNYRVLDALATLAFHYPPRALFFRSELEHLLLLSREQHLDPRAIQGSYAGAMGLPQFIPSSYRRYAVDFDGDRLTDLWHNPGDAMASVANYLKIHGWETGRPVAIRTQIGGWGYAQFLDGKLEPKIELTRLKQAGITPVTEIQGNPLVALIALETETGGYEYWLGLKNFYVITRYNRSPLYAMAVYQLAQAIRDRYREEYSASYARKHTLP
jgi:membrane-bound lytic murein transglycosylase B